MKILPIALVLLTAASLLAACGEKPEPAPAAAVETAPAAAPAPTTTPGASAGDGAMAGMDMAGAKMAKATGTVTAVDAAANSITLDHGPVPEAGWPAMTMAFKASASMVQTAKVGDKVAVDLMIKDGAGEITALSKQ